MEVYTTGTAGIEELTSELFIKNILRQTLCCVLAISQFC